MRKYTQPKCVGVEEIDNISEKVFMWGSGDIWSQGPCFIKYTPEVDKGPGVPGHEHPYWIYKIHVTHQSGVHTDPHHDIGQNYIFIFNQELPAGTIVTTNAGSEGVPGIDGKSVLFTRNRTAEVQGDDITYADFEVHFDFSQTDIPEAMWHDTAASIKLQTFNVNDYFLWTP